MTRAAFYGRYSSEGQRVAKGTTRSQGGWVNELVEEEVRDLLKKYQECRRGDQ